MTTDPHDQYEDAVRRRGSRRPEPRIEWSDIAWLIIGPLILGLLFFLLAH